MLTIAYTDTHTCDDSAALTFTFRAPRLVEAASLLSLMLRRLITFLHLIFADLF